MPWVELEVPLQNSQPELIKPAANQASEYPFACPLSGASAWGPAKGLDGRLVHSWSLADFTVRSPRARTAGMPPIATGT